MGPAAMTTILFSVDNHGWLITLASLIVNLLIVWFFLRKSEWVVGIIGDSGSRAMGKVMALFLAAIAVMMIRVGLSGLVKIH
jgi:multiple antibiotic resistance protein